VCVCVVHFCLLNSRWYLSQLSLSHATLSQTTLSLSLSNYSPPPCCLPNKTGIHLALVGARPGECGVRCTPTRVGDACQFPAQPPTARWRCALTAYHDGVHCDCECGATDPDCWQADRIIVGCSTLGMVCPGPAGSCEVARNALLDPALGQLARLSPPSSSSSSFSSSSSTSSSFSSSASSSSSSPPSALHTRTSSAELWIESSTSEREREAETEREHEGKGASESETERETETRSEGSESARETETTSERSESVRESEAASERDHYELTSSDPMQLRVVCNPEAGGGPHCADYCQFDSCTYYGGDRLRRCYETLRISVGDALSTLDTLQRMLDVYAFTDISRRSPDMQHYPLQVDLRAQLASLRQQVLSDYVFTPCVPVDQRDTRDQTDQTDKREDDGLLSAVPFHERLAELYTQLNDAHTAYLKPRAFGSSYFLQPLLFDAFSATGMMVDHNRSHRNSKNSNEHEHEHEQGTNSDLRFSVAGVLLPELGSLVGMQVLEIDGRSPLQVFRERADSVGVSRDHGTRFNMAVDYAWAQRSQSVFSRVTEDSATYILLNGTGRMCVCVCVCVFCSLASSFDCSLFLE
jgi:hypothetical protein